MSRYRFVKDDDGHNYLIPVDLTEDFYDDLVQCLTVEGGLSYCKFNNTFDQYRCDSISNFTFENPLED